MTIRSVSKVVSVLSLAALLSVGSMAQAKVLVSDSFDFSGSGPADINSDLAARQTGELGQISWWTGPGISLDQVGTYDKGLKFTNTGGNSYASASLNRDFVNDFSLRISFDVTPMITGSPDDWFALTLFADQGEWLPNKAGLLLRGNGGFGVFGVSGTPNNVTLVGGVSHHVVTDISLSGSDRLMSISIDGQSIITDQTVTCAVYKNYIGLHSAGWSDPSTTGIDNFVIEVPEAPSENPTPTPEPAGLMALASGIVGLGGLSLRRRFVK